MKEFIEVTSGFTNCKVSVLKSAIISFSEYKEHLSINQMAKEKFKDIKSTIVFKRDMAHRPYDEKSSVVLQHTTMYLTDTYTELKKELQ